MQAHSPLFDAVGCPPRPVSVDNVVSVGSCWSDTGEHTEAAEAERNTGGEEFRCGATDILCRIGRVIRCLSAFSHEGPP